MNTRKIMYKIRKYPKLKAILSVPYKAFNSIRVRKLKKELGDENLAFLSKVDIDSKNIWYFGVVSHDNMGDRAQWCCTYTWMEENYPNAKIIPIYAYGFDFYEKKIMKILKRLIKKEDLIFFQSGYIFTGKHPNENTYYKVVKNFPNNKMIFLPQTVFFETDKLKRQTAKRYGEHEHILMLARDKVSFELAKEILPKADVILFPDIVTTKIGANSYLEERDGILMVVRDDAEQYYDRKDIEVCANKLREFTNVDMTDTTIKGVATTKKEYNEYIDKLIQNYSHYKCIITDRFHGTIFGLSAETPIIVIRTTDHKVTTGAEWFKPIYPDMIKTADTLDDALVLAKDILSGKISDVKEEYFKETYYDKLKQMITELK